MILTQIMRILKNRHFFIMLVIAPLIGVGLSFFFAQMNNSNGAEPKSPTAFISEDEGELSKSLYKEKQLVSDRIKAEELLKKGKVDAVFIIPATFSSDIKEGKLPKVEVLQLEEGQSFASFKLSEDIKKLVMNTFLEKENAVPEPHKSKVIFKKNGSIMNMAYIIFAMMIIYFIVMSSAKITEDLTVLKDSGVLRRNFLSPHKESSVIISLVLSYMLIEFVLYAFYSSLIFYILKISPSEFPKFVLIIALSVFLAMSMSIFIMRFVKNAQSCSMLLSMISMLMFFGALFKFTNPDSAIAKFSVLSPIHYMVNIVDKGEVFPGALITALISLVLLVIGSFGAKDLVKE